MVARIQNLPTGGYRYVLTSFEFVLLNWKIILMIPSIKNNHLEPSKNNPFGYSCSQIPMEWTVSITNYGGIITSIQVPKNDELIETTLGFNTLEEYLSEDYRKNYPYLGALIGRNAGRIQNGNCPLEGHMWQLTVNPWKASTSWRF